MKNYLSCILVLLVCFCGFAQVGIGTSDPKAALDVESTSSGFIMPRFADHTILTPSLNKDQQGMQVYNTTTNTIWCWEGTARTECGSARNFDSFYVELSGSPSTPFNNNTFLTHVFPNVISSPAGAYNPTNGQITIPSAGLYQIKATIRVADGSPVRSQFSFGVDTSNIDGPWFLWHMVQNVTVTSRTSYPLMRVVRLNANDQLRMFVFADTNPLTFQTAGLQVIKVSK